MQVEAVSRPYFTSLSFRPLSEKLIEYWKWIISHGVTFLIFTCALLCGIAVYVSTTDKIVVGPFSVPKQYEDRGYNSEAISNAVVQFIHGNESNVALVVPRETEKTSTISSDDMEGGLDEDNNILENIDGQHVVSSFVPSTIADVKVPLTSFTLESLIELLRTTVGHQPTRIAGEIVAVDENTSGEPGAADPQRTKVLIRYKIEYPEPSFSILGYHWWSRRITTLTDTFTADGAEEAIQKLAFITADGVEQRTLVHEGPASRALRYVARGNTYFGLKDYERASRMYEQANSLLDHARKPRSAHAYLALGVIAEREGDVQAAHQYYAAAAQTLSPDDDDDASWARLYLGNQLVREGNRMQAAVEQYQAVLSTSEGKKGEHKDTVVKAAADNNLGFLYLSGAQWNRAATYFEDAQKRAYSVREVARTCAYGDAEEGACGTSLSEDQRQEAKVESLSNINVANHLLAISFYGMGQVASRLRNRLAVEEDYRQAIHADATYAPAHYRLGRIYSTKHQYRKAVDEFQAAIDADGQFKPAYDAWKNLADLWPRLPERKKTERSLSLALASKYKVWGDAYRRAGNPDEAAERFCVAAAFDPQYSDLCATASRKAKRLS